MEKLKQYKYIILISVLTLGFVFYWFEWRPAEIRKNCWAKTKETIKNYSLSPLDVQRTLEICIEGSGLEK